MSRINLDIEYDWYVTQIYITSVEYGNNPSRTAVLLAILATWVPSCRGVRGVRGISGGKPCLSASHHRDGDGDPTDVVWAPQASRP